MITGRSERLRIQRQSSSPSVPGQHHVEHDERRVGGLDQLAGAVAVAGLERREAVALQVADDHVADDRLVVDDEDGRHRGLLRLPLGVVARRPLLADRPDRDPAQRVARRRVDHGEVEVADQQRERDVHQPVVEDDRAREAKLRVALAEPEQQARRRGRGRVKAAVSAVLSFWPALKRPCGAGLAAGEPAEVVAVEAVDLARRAQDPAPVADERRSATSTTTQAIPDQKWTLWTSGRRPTAIARLGR